MKGIKAVILLLLSMNAWSADIIGVPTLNEVSYQDPTSCLAFVYGESGGGAKPACANQSLDRLVFDFCSVQGKAWFSMILAFNAQNKTMRLVGSGDCDLFNNTESVQFIRANEGG